MNRIGVENLECMDNAIGMIEDRGLGRYEW